MSLLKVQTAVVRLDFVTSLQRGPPDPLSTAMPVARIGSIVAMMARKYPDQTSTNAGPSTRPTEPLVVGD
jgi:hypothetical protein